MEHHTTPAKDTRIPLWLNYTQVGEFEYALAKTAQLVKAHVDRLDAEGSARYRARIDRIKVVEKVVRSAHLGRIDLDVEQVEIALYCLSRGRHFLDRISAGKKGADLGATLKRAEAIGLIHGMLLDAEAAEERRYLFGAAV